MSATITLNTAGTYYAHVYLDNYSALTQSNTSNDIYPTRRQYLCAFNPLDCQNRRGKLPREQLVVESNSADCFDATTEPYA